MDVLGELVAHPGYGTAVMHWFSGTQSELKAAIAHGCWFSVGPAMFESANGRAIAASMPRNRVVPESDGPFAQVAHTTVMPWSADETARHLARTWGMTTDDANKILHENGEELIKAMVLP
jgi:TatD DNase family protein